MWPMQRRCAAAYGRVNRQGTGRRSQRIKGRHLRQNRPKIHEGDARDEGERGADVDRAAVRHRDIQAAFEDIYRVLQPSAQG